MEEGAFCARENREEAACLIGAPFELGRKGEEKARVERTVPARGAPLLRLVGVGGAGTRCVEGGGSVAVSCAWDSDSDGNSDWGWDSDSDSDSDCDWDSDWDSG